MKEKEIYLKIKIPDGISENTCLEIIRFSLNNITREIELLEKKKLKVEDYTQIGYSCPASWELKLRDGRRIFIRYRWGVLTVYLNPDTEDEEILFRKEFEDDIDVDTPMLKKLTGEILDWK